MNRTWMVTVPALLGTGLLVGLLWSPARGGDSGSAIPPRPAAGAGAAGAGG